MPLDAVTPELRRYLLGGLDDAGAAALEARYVADPVLLGEIGAVEEALIDDFLGDRLSADERHRFETVYLASPVHRDRVSIARAWRERLTIRDAPPRATAPGFYGWMLAAAAIVLMALWVTALPAPVPQQAATPRVAPAPAPSVPAPPTPAPPQPLQLRAVVALTLSPIATRGGARQTHRQPSLPTDLHLRLEGAPVPGDEAYAAEVQTVEGRVAWRGRARAAAEDSGLLTTLVVPAESLAADDYVVVVTAANGDERGRYTLRLRAR